jgi:hypothetical protein
LRAESPEKWAQMVERGRLFARKRRENLSGRQNASRDYPIETKSPDEPGQPAQNVLPAVDVQPEPKDSGVGEVRESIFERPEKRTGDSRGGGQDLLVRVTAIPVNPRLVFAGNDVCARFEVIVGDNSRLWLGAPMYVRESLSYPGFYEMVGELPRGRWDRAYAEKFADVAGN